MAVRRERPMDQWRFPQGKNQAKPGDEVSIIAHYPSGWVIEKIVKIERLTNTQVILEIHHLSDYERRWHRDSGYLVGGDTLWGKHIELTTPKHREQLAEREAKEAKQAKEKKIRDAEITERETRCKAARLAYWREEIITAHALLISHQSLEPIEAVIERIWETAQWKAIGDILTDEEGGGE